MGHTPVSAPAPLRALAVAAERRWARLPANLRGAVWITLASLAFTFMAATIKTLGPGMSSFEIAFFRCLIGLVITLPFCLRAGSAAFATRRPGMHFGRATAGVSAVFCGYYGITHLALADVTAISFTKTLFMILLAVLFLNETVHRRRWTATAIGFTGVLIMLRPGGEGPAFATLVALAGAASVSAGIVFVKKLARTEKPVTILFYYGVISTLVSFPPAAYVWKTPAIEELALLILVAALAVTGQFLAIRGYGAGEVTAVVPFGYMRLVFAGLVGFALFAEVPDAWSLAGAAVIAASTLYIGLREAKQGRRPAAAEPDAVAPP